MKIDQQFGMNHRAFLGGSTGTLGMMALSQLLGGETARTHHRARAKSVICLFQHGGPSQVDLFDPKPELNRWHGKNTMASLRRILKSRWATVSHTVWV